jgi:hypothetical protein
MQMNLAWPSAAMSPVSFDDGAEAAVVGFDHIIPLRHLLIIPLSSLLIIPLSSLLIIPLSSLLIIPLSSLLIIPPSSLLIILLSSLLIIPLSSLLIIPLSSLLKLSFCRRVAAIERSPAFQRLVITQNFARNSR